MNCLNTTKILFPTKEVDLSKWAVVACDQYTSQPEYWNEVSSIVGESPSTLHITLPEIFLECDEISQKTQNVYKNMKDYISHGKLSELDEGLVLVERYSGHKQPRRGIVLEADLECYDFNVGSSSYIRPTEKTIIERIPPRLEIRKNATLELPHVMLIIDDPEQKIIEPLFSDKNSLECIYNIDLMQDSGKISGYFVEKGEKTDEILRKLDTLFNEDVFCKKYNLEKSKHSVLPFAVGDGNHSLATAKSHWLEIKKNLSENEQKNHPARFCLVEIVNIHEESLIIEPIHRVLFDTSKDDLLNYANVFFEKNNCKVYVSEKIPENTKNTHYFPFYILESVQYLIIEEPKWAIPIATLQMFLDEFLENFENSRIDYIHGIDIVKKLSKNQNTIGFILPDIEKGDIFKGVILDGVLPRKTFSMGEAHEKRFYIESRKIVL